MGFVISPTLASGLSPASWTLDLPLPRQWSVLPSQAGESTGTISGTTVHSLWAPDVSSATPEYAQEITEAQYQRFEQIYLHATARTWIVAIDGRIFEASIEITQAERIRRSAGMMRDVACKLRIVREVLV
jgi:hypothetical protein